MHKLRPGSLVCFPRILVKLHENFLVSKNGRHNAGGVLPVRAKPNCALCVYVAVDRPACPPTPPPSHQWDSCHLCPLLTLYPHPPPPHQLVHNYSPSLPPSRLLFAYYILQDILHNIYMRTLYYIISYYIILYVHGWYIKPPMYLLFIWALYLVPWAQMALQKSLDFRALSPKMPLVMDSPPSKPLRTAPINTRYIS